MIACEKETVQKGFAESGNSKDFIIFPHNFKGRSCFRIIWGYYPAKQDAENAYKGLPAMFRDSGAKIVPFDSMKP
jgi:septal ring-binding cell division protein DamX